MLSLQNNRKVLDKSIQMLDNWLRLLDKMGKMPVKMSNISF